MARLLLRGFTVCDSNDPNFNPRTVFQQDVFGRHANSNCFSFGHLQESFENVERGAKRKHSRRNRQFNVGGRPKIHRTNSIFEYDLVGTSANSARLILSLGSVGTFRSSRTGRNDNFNTDQRIHSEQSKNFANKTDEKQRRTRQIDERSLKRNKSAEAIRVGAELRGANFENTKQRNEST